METELWKQSYCLPNKLFTMGHTIFELWVMETENWVIKKLNPNRLLVFPFPCCWSSSILLYLSTLSISCRKLVTGLPVRDFLKPCPDGRPTLKVLITTSSKSPSILLNISQYLSAYAFTDSPSLIVINSRESKGWGTLLHVINREQNDWVSFLKELMEFVLNPSNHLIGIGPKLEGNTLHSKASSWEWTAIFYLNWLTCSTGSIRPLYMVNVGWWKRLGSFAFSIPWVKGDLEIWLRAFFMTLVSTPLPDGLLHFLLREYSSSQE